MILKLIQRVICMLLKKERQTKIGSLPKLARWRDRFINFQINSSNSQEFMKFAIFSRLYFSLLENQSGNFSFSRQIFLQCWNLPRYHLLYQHFIIFFGSCIFSVKRIVQKSDFTDVRIVWSFSNRKNTTIFFTEKPLRVSDKNSIDFSFDCTRKNQATFEQKLHSQILVKKYNYLSQF